MTKDPRPYDIVARRKVGENTKWRVWFDHLRDEAGIDIPSYLRLEPQILVGDRLTGVGVLPVLTDGRLWLTRIYRHAIEEWGWELSRGFCDAGETIEEAARRELSEEAALVCAPDGLHLLGHVAPEPSTIAGRIALFAAVDCRPSGAAPEHELGVAESGLFTVDDVADLVAGPTLQDACTIIAFHRYLATLVK